MSSVTGAKRPVANSGNGSQSSTRLAAVAAVLGQLIPQVLNLGCLCSHGLLQLTHLLLQLQDDRYEVISNIVDGRLDECLANAVRAFIDHRDALPADAVLVEGVYYHGGQPHLHTWIETSNSIIELSLVHNKSLALYGPVQHYPIQPRSESEINRLYGDEPHEPGVSLIMKLDWDDPRVVNLLNEIDTPPSLRR